jgi:hypothetical protein
MYKIINESKDFTCNQLRKTDGSPQSYISNMHGPLQPQQTNTTPLGSSFTLHIL